MTTIRKYALRFFAALALIFALSAGVYLSFSAASAESMDKLRTNFTEGSEGWTVNQNAVISSSQGLQLLPGGRAQTEDTMSGVLLFIEFGAVGEGFTVELGVSGDQAAASLVFDGDILRTEGLETAEGAADAVLDRTLGNGSMLKVEMIAGYVEVSVKEAEGSFDDLGKPCATLYFTDDSAMTEGNIALSVSESGSTAVVRFADLYSLSGNIFIETEDAPVEEETTETEPEDNGGIPWWGIMLIVIAAILVLGGGATAVVIFKKKSKGKKPAHGDSDADGSVSDGGPNGDEGGRSE